jgi:NTP pyrophosphatase (non-canonical NTP hydrolase)
MSIRSWQIRVHELAISKGWWDSYPKNDNVFVLTTDQILSKLALIHSEVSEALEDARIGKMLTSGGVVYREDGTIDLLATIKPVGFASELADVVIRCFDLASAMGIDLEREIEIKHQFNKTRAARHGGKLA